jgi:hypothetical protein
VGNGKTTSFWSSCLYIQGVSPRHIAPSLLKKGKRNKIKVYKALEGNKWFDHITPLNIYIEVIECVSLWEAIQDISLDNNEKDKIRWRWTSNDEYSTKSAYHIQFVGTFSKLRILPI